MSDGPWIKFYPSDWLTGTRGMTAAEMGVYISLIMMMYEKGGPISADGSRLARLCGLARPTFEKILAGLVDAKKVRKDGDNLFHERVENELRVRQNFSDAQRKAAVSRWEKRKENQDESEANALPAQSPRAPDQISERRYQKEEDTKPHRLVDSESQLVDVSAKRPTSAERGTRLPAGWVLPDEWAQWCRDQWPNMPDSFVKTQAEQFSDHWRSLPGAKARKADWLATWRKWMRESVDRHRARQARAGPPPGRMTQADAGRIATEFFRKQAEEGEDDEQSGTGEGERLDRSDAPYLLSRKV